MSAGNDEYGVDVVTAEATGGHQPGYGHVIESDRKKDDASDEFRRDLWEDPFVTASA